jgi:hypothetical protein
VTDLENYQTRAQAADTFEVSDLTMRKYETRAEEEGIVTPALKFGNMRLRTKDDWVKVYALTLEPYIAKAEELNLVVRFNYHEESLMDEYQRGYTNGHLSCYENGVNASIAPTTSPLNETEDVEATNYVAGSGLTQGGFVPLGQLGL